MIFDTHTHYDDEVFDRDRNELLMGLPSGNVGAVCNVGSTLEGAEKSVELASRYAHVYAAVGIHPDEVYDFYPEEISRPFSAEAAEKLEEKFLSGQLSSRGNKVLSVLRKLSEDEKVRAVGEIGLDYHGYGRFEIKPSKELQALWFRRQLELAIDIGKPVVIHSRNAAEDTFRMMKEAHEKGLTGAVIHCYSYSNEMASMYLDMGFYLGIGGVLTYEGQKKLTKALRITPIDRVLLETDAPYLIPAEARALYQTSRNESKYLSFVAKKIASVKGMTAEEVEKATYENARKFYRIDT